MHFRNTFYKLLALTCLFTLTYPFVSVSESIIFKSTHYFRGMAFSFTMLFSGLALAHIIYRNYSIDKCMPKKHLLLYNLAEYLSLAIPAILSFLLFSSRKAVFFSAVSLIYFFTGLKSYWKEYYDVLNSKIISTCIPILVFSMFAPNIFNSCRHLNIINTIYVYISIFIIFFLLNQNSLDMAFEHNITEISGEPPKLRIFNLFIVVLLYVFLVLLINFKKIVVFMLILPSIIAGWIIVHLKLSRFYVQAPEPAENKISSIIPMEPKSQSDLPLLIICIVLVSVALLFIFFIFKKFIRTFINKIIHLFTNLFKYNSNANTFNNYYQDKVETVKTDGLLGSNARISACVRRNIKALRRITDPILKVRYMYGIGLDMLINKGITVKKSDTVREIQIKSMQVECFKKYFNSITGVYEKARYAKSKPSIAEIEECEKKLREILK